MDDNERAWERLKEAFRQNAINQHEWVIDEVHRTIYNVDTHTGVTSTSYPFWRHIRNHVNKA